MPQERLNSVCSVLGRPRVSAIIFALCCQLCTLTYFVGSQGYKFLLYLLNYFTISKEGGVLGGSLVYDSITFCDLKLLFFIYC